MSEYYRRGLLVDTNVLLLFLLGSLDRKLIQHKIVSNQGFDEADFDSLVTFVSRFQKLITTPHILTEVSNHAEKLKGEDRQRIFLKLVSLIEAMDEHSEPSKQISRSDAFVRFGLTDAAISAIAKKQFLVLTVDFALTGYLRKQGIEAINFNNVRQFTLQ
jgi:rRNA-processing protein FCF1